MWIHLIFAIFAAQSETVTENLAQSRDWKSFVVEDHLATGKVACLAATEDESARLEVYSESPERVEGFQKPMVQVVLSGQEGKNFLAGKMKVNGKTFDLSVLGRSADLESRLVARSGDVSGLITALKRGRSVELELFGLGIVGKKEFSLSGSTRSIEKMLRSCDVE